ncbi:MAG: glutamine amidotransferase [Cellvibrionaceae bacterium]|jgi:glutamine amidotransferase
MTKSSVAIIDYGMGNLHSVASALAHISPDSDIRIVDQAEYILSADRVIFPGVGAIRDCMAEIRRLNFDKLVPSLLAQGKPLLGICVGMQVLLDHSEENGGVRGLGLLPGDVKFFGDSLQDSQGDRLKVPHMGWNTVEQTLDHPLWHGIQNNSYFYFVHSYYVSARNLEQVAGRCQYSLPFAAAISHKNLFATQFHPEKSHAAGLQLLKNFINWSGDVT